MNHPKKDWQGTQRKADITPLKEVIEEFLKTNKLRGKFKETFLINSWERVMGKVIAQRTVHLKIEKGMMYVELNSAALKNELSLSKKKIMKLLEEELGERVIDDITFL